MFLIGIFLSAYPFVASLRLSDKAKNDSVSTIEITELKPGAVYKYDVNGIPLFILKPDEEQTTSLAFLDSHVWEPNVNTFNHEIGAYVYWGVSTKWGCLLAHYDQENGSTMTRWQPSESKWFGGYWDYSCEISYDYAGRAIKTYNYSYNGFNGKYENLHSPSIFRKAKNGYIVSIYQR